MHIEPDWSTMKTTFTGKFEGSGGSVQTVPCRESRSSTLFVFFGKRRDAIKILFADASGLCLFYKRLDRGTFRVPLVHEAGAASLAIDERALDDLLDGIDVEAQAKTPRRRSARVH